MANDGHEMSAMKVIDEDDVSTEALLQLFRRAFLKAKIDDDGDVYITDGLDFPIWVAVDVEQRLIRFFTFMQREEGSTLHGGCGEPCERNRRAADVPCSVRSQGSALARTTS